MGKAIAISLRRQIIQEWSSKRISFKDLASKFGISYNTIRSLCKDYSTKGEAAFFTHYGNCGQRGLQFEPLIYRAACYLKFLHRDWGAPYIHSILVERYSQYQIPSERTLQIWFKQKGYQKVRTQVFLPRPTAPKANSAHETWQIDAKEVVQLKTGEQCCWLTIADEATGSMLAANIFSLCKDQSSRTNRIAKLFKRHLYKMGITR